MLDERPWQHLTGRELAGMMATEALASRDGTLAREEREGARRRLEQLRDEHDRRIARPLR